MKLQELAKKPQLIELTIDSPEIIEEFGESLTFWTWDRQPLPVFMKLASITGENAAVVVDAIRELVLDEKGKQIINNETSLPSKVMMAVITKVLETLGK